MAQHQQLRFSSRSYPTYPLWASSVYESKAYLSDHDWRVDAGDAHAKIPRPSVPRSTHANALAFSSRATDSDALEEYNFTVFKVGKRAPSSSATLTSSSTKGWWNNYDTSANPHNLRKGKTISIHGETVFDAIEKRRAASAKASSSSSSAARRDAHENAGDAKLFDVRDPPMRARTAAEKEVVEKVRANAFTAMRPSTYVDTSSRAEDAKASGKTTGDPKKPRPGWVSSTLLEDTLDHASPGAYNALRYVEQRNRKFALAQSVAKLNHTMRRHHVVRRLEDQKLQPLKDTISGLEKRQGDLEKENRELQDLVKELHSVVEDHQRQKEIQRKAKAEKKARPSSSGGPKTKRANRPSPGASRLRRSPAKPRTARAPSFDASSRPPTQSARSSAGEGSSAVAKKQRSQWRQPRTTAKQRAMSERTQAFQQAMSAISTEKGGQRPITAEIEKTLEAYARAQAEAELRAGEGTPNAAAATTDDLMDGLDQRLQHVKATFSEAAAAAAAEEEEEEPEEAKVVVVPTSGAQTTRKTKASKKKSKSKAKPMARAPEPGAALDGDLRDSLMQAVQRELQKQIDTDQGDPPPAPDQGGDRIEGFMEDTNRKLAALSDQLGALGGRESAEERIQILGPKPKKKLVFAEPVRGEQPERSEVTFSALKAPKAARPPGESPLPKHLIVGSDNTLTFASDVRRDVSSLSERAKAEILERREAYLRHQRQNDEFVYANTASRDFDPVKISEMLSDLIIGDLLDDSARELGNVCDAICEKVFEQEFKPPQQGAKGQGQGQGEK